MRNFYTIVFLLVILLNNSSLVLAMSLPPKNDQLKVENPPIETSEPKATEFKKLALDEIEVKDSKLKKVKFVDFLVKDINIVLFVKPHCPFCESFLSIANASKSKISENLIIVMDSTNASAENFTEKSKSLTNMKNAIWVYDYESNLRNHFSIEAFPQFLIINKDRTVLATQKGLIKPENQEILQGKQFGEVLLILSKNTLNWLEKGEF